ncbi:single-stranded DNA-binding protein [Psychromicrobium lacuslunae]|uniref:Single-stranded DNA-binding protein n=1 Tax=Psychromicrobium lacuslunae TaxID=1618207 RepID=A0A0D4C1Z6_9MICC|nr:single-stranded DNA-binding protein [Psychromicrobium lacuslunae]AJT42396.1 hypothetical protein UM93_14465 [Psychromicrobium lacuslunae]
MAQVNFHGWLSADTDLRFSQNGLAILTLKVPENHSKRNQSGGWDQTGTTWWKVTFFGALAELWGNAGLKKGTHVEISGPSKTETWQGQNGENMSVLAVTDPAMKIITDKPKAGDGDNPWSTPTASQNASWGEPNNDEPPF